MTAIWSSVAASSAASAGIAPPKNIINGFSTSSIYEAAIPNDAQFKGISSGALTANVLATALSITGSGKLKLLAIASADATARTLRVKVTIDGTACFDSTSPSISTSQHGFVVVGQLNASGLMLIDATGAAFITSLLVEIASSLTETNKATVYTEYHTN